MHSKSNDSYSASFLRASVLISNQRRFDPTSVPKTILSFAYYIGMTGGKMNRDPRLDERVTSYLIDVYIEKTNKI